MIFLLIFLQCMGNYSSRFWWHDCSTLYDRFMKANRDWWRCFTGWWITHKLMLFLTFSLFSLQMRVRAGGRTVAGVGSVWSGKYGPCRVCVPGKLPPFVCARVWLWWTFLWEPLRALPHRLPAAEENLCGPQQRLLFQRWDACSSCSAATRLPVLVCVVCTDGQCICCFSKDIFQGIIFKEMFWVQFTLICNVEGSYSLWMCKTSDSLAAIGI